MVRITIHGGNFNSEEFSKATGALVEVLKLQKDTQFYWSEIPEEQRLYTTMLWDGETILHQLYQPGKINQHLTNGELTISPVPIMGDNGNVIGLDFNIELSE